MLYKTMYVPTASPNQYSINMANKILGVPSNTIAPSERAWVCEPYVFETASPNPELPHSSSPSMRENQFQIRGARRASNSAAAQAAGSK